MRKSVSIFLNSAGALLLALASALFVINLAFPIDAVQPHEPIFFLPLNGCFWVIGGIALMIALVCFFSECPVVPAVLLAWFSLNFWVWRIGFLAQGCSSLNGYLGGFAYAFDVPPKAAAATSDIVFSGFLGGSFAVLWAIRRLPPETQFKRISCPSCGIRIQFALENLGRKIPCPQCKTTITLHKPGNLKMSCFFCKGHIEFPTHSVGGKIKCPHCHMDIVLKEPSTA